MDTQKVEYLQVKVTQWCRQAMERDGDYSYYWELATPIIVRNREILDNHFYDWIDGKISEAQLRMHFDTYLFVIKKESYKAWEDERKAWREKSGYHSTDEWYEPVPSTPLPYRELHFINERWANWCWKDGEYNLEHTSPWKYNPKTTGWNYDEPFTNQFPPPNLEPVNTTIRSLQYTLQFGKKHKGKTLETILKVDPDYLKWLLRLDRFNFSDEIKAKIKEVCEKEAFWD